MRSWSCSKRAVPDYFGTTDWSTIRRPTRLTPVGTRAASPLIRVQGLHGLGIVETFLVADESPGEEPAGMDNWKAAGISGMLKGRIFGSGRKLWPRTKQRLRFPCRLRLNEREHFSSSSMGWRQWSDWGRFSGGGGRMKTLSSYGLSRPEEERVWKSALFATTILSSNSFVRYPVPACWTGFADGSGRSRREPSA